MGGVLRRIRVPRRTKKAGSHDIAPVIEFEVALEARRRGHWGCDVLEALA
jgi:hypothetical protein